MICGQKVNKKIRKDKAMTQNHKEMTLKELEEWLGKEQVEHLFLEHYLTLVGKDNQKVKLADHLNLDDIME